MKKLILTIISLLFISSSWAGDRPVDYSLVPAAAKTLINKYFPKIKVSASMVDQDIMSKEYKVYLENGTTIEFNEKGAWKEIDCGANAIPSGIIPSKIASYVKNSYAGSSIVKIEIDNDGYDVRLSTGIELKFNTAQAFVGIDD